MITSPNESATSPAFLKSLVYFPPHASPVMVPQSQLLPGPGSFTGIRAFANFGR